jgi:hypothetical protein
MNKQKLKQTSNNTSLTRTWNVRAHVSRGNFKYRKAKTSVVASVQTAALKVSLVLVVKVRILWTGFRAIVIYSALAQQTTYIGFVSQSMPSQALRNSKVRNSLNDSYATNRQDGRDACGDLLRKAITRIMHMSDIHHLPQCPGIRLRCFSFSNEQWLFFLNQPTDAFRRHAILTGRWEAF